MDNRLRIPILLKIVEWYDEWRQQGDSRYGAPDTKRVTEHFNLNHADTLELLNSLELLGWITKHRRISAGLTGYGYDGALHSAVEPTEKGREVVSQVGARDQRSGPLD